jgi:thioredoxin 1
MKRNYIASLLLVPIVAMMLAACGGSNSGSKYGSATTSASTGAATGNAAQVAALAKPQFIMFSTTWCEVCKAMRPLVSQLRSQYQDRVDFREIDREDPANAAMVAKYGVSAQPIFVFLDRQGNQVGKIIGGTDKGTLKAALDKMVQ